MIPEIFWIGLIQAHHGHKRGVDLITSIARAARIACPNPQSRIFGATSTYSQLSEIEWGHVRARLAETGDLFPIQDALRPLVINYPNCPFLKLFSSQLDEPSPEHLGVLKQQVNSMYDRKEYEPMMFQATFIWLAFDANMLKVVKDLALAKLPEIEQYPATELSRQVGASVRATLNMCFGSFSEHYPSSCSWPVYFWNRGLILDDCEFADGE